MPGNRETPSSVPGVRRPKPAVPRGPGRKAAQTPAWLYRYRFPAPDDELFDGVDQAEFAIQYFVFVLVLMVAVASFAAFVLVPLVGRIFAG